MTKSRFISDPSLDVLRASIGSVVHWSQSPIATVEVCRLSPYGALVVSHQDALTWAFYGEYDGDLFVTFDKGVCDALRKESDETIEVA